MEDLQVIATFLQAYHDAILVK